MLHQLEPVGHMHCRFSNPALVTHLASYALGRSPQYMVLYISHILMHWGDDPSTPDLLYCMSVHYTVLQIEEPAALARIFRLHIPAFATE